MKLLGRITASAVSAGKWPIFIIEAGKSINGVDYPPPMLMREAEAGTFEGVTVSAYGKIDANGMPIEDHVTEGMIGLSVLNAVGKTRNTRWSESEQAVVGELHLSLGIREADAYESVLQAHAANGNIDVPGLSIDAIADVVGGVVRSFESCIELTIVTHPSAGGRFATHRIAASATGVPMFDKILTFLRESFPALLGVYQGPASVDHLSAHLARNVREGATGRSNLIAALGELGKANPATALRVGDPTTRIVEGIDELGILAEVKMLVSIVEESLQQKAGAAIAAASEVAATAAATAGATAPAAVAAVTPEATAIAEAEAAAEPTDEEKKKMAEEEEEKKKVQESDRANSAFLQAEADRARVVASERNISEACKAAGLSNSVADSMVTNAKGSVVDSATATAMAQQQQMIIDGAVREAAAGGVLGAQVVRESADKMRDGLAHLFSRKCEVPAEGGFEHPSIIRYIEHMCMGNERISECVSSGQKGRKRIKEAIDSTNFDQAYQDALNLALLAEFKGFEYLQVWRQMVSPRPMKDFRSHKTIRVGYYDALPTVAEKGTYNYLTTPTDQQETIQLAKKGGLESISMEQLLNDDLGLYQKMLNRLARAAAETRYEVFFNLIRIATQPTMTDGSKLTSAGRSPANLLTTALTADATGKTAFIAAEDQMEAATGGSGKPKGITPKFLIIPKALRQAANYVLQEMVGGNTGTDMQAYMNRFGIAIPQPVVDRTTSNNTDWFLMADPNDAPVVEYGTLGGRDEPEIFISDDQRFGSVFTNDNQEMKIRDIFAFAAMDPTGIQGNNVA